MDLAALTWGLTVWLVCSSQCYAASLSGPLNTQDGPSGHSIPPDPALGHQDASPASLDKDQNQQIKVALDVTGSSNPAASDSSKPKSELQPHPQSFPEFIEDGIEEEDENGVIRGKYVYMEEDGVPAQLEYEAVPGLRFEIKSYLKGTKLLPPPDLNENPERGQALAENADKKNKNTSEENGMADSLKTTSSVLNGKDPEYEHASVIGRYVVRKTRSINDNYKKSEAVENEARAENSEIRETQDNNSEPPVDASYRFGFSADGQTRDEEADALGNVQGSYSYIGEDGVRTKVEYEAGPGKGFIVKRIVHEDTGISLEPPKPEVSEEVSQSPGKFDTKNKIPSEITPDERVKSEDHQIQTTHKKVSTTNKEQYNEEGKTDVKQSDDGSYSFSYATPNQWRKESVDANGHVRNMYSFVAQTPVNKNEHAHYKDTPINGYNQKSIEVPLIQSIPPTINQNTLKINNDGYYSYSYEIPEENRAEPGQMKKYDPLPSTDTSIITPTETEEPTKEKDLSTTKDINSDVDSASPYQNDGSYSYSYETADQTRQEAADVYGNVEGQYSFIADDGIRRTVHYKVTPDSGFTAEGFHLPSLENVDKGIDASNTEVKVNSASINTPVLDSKFNHGHSSTVEQTYPQNGNNQKEIIPTEKLSSSQIISYIPQIPHYTPQVILDLSEIRRAVATKDNSQVHKHKKVVKKRPIKATTENLQPDGSYSFTYGNNDQHREESVDTDGNVYSKYQYKTNDDGRTVVVVVKKSLKKKANEDTLAGEKTARNVPEENVDEDRSYTINNRKVRRTLVNRKRHVEGLSNADIQKQESTEQINSNVKNPENHYPYKIQQPHHDSKEGIEIKTYRTAKSITRPFRGNVKYQ